LLYLNFNSHKSSSIYIFAIAAREPDKWRRQFDYTFSVTDPKGSGAEPYIGCRAIANSGFKLGNYLRLLGHLAARVWRRDRPS
jgi:hypothetical protein